MAEHTGLTRRNFIRQSVLAAAGIPLTGGILSAFTSDSWPARTGMRTVYLARKSVLNLTQQEKDDFTAAVVALKSIKSPWSSKLSYYDQFVWWHKRTFDCDLGSAHMGPAFLPWHRLFLLYFEDALNATGVSTNPISIPYWHWPKKTAIDVVFSEDFMGPEGDPGQNWAVARGPFRRGNFRINVFDPWVNDRLRRTELVRRFGTNGWQLPTQDEVDAALAVPNYDHTPWDPSSPPDRSFRNNLEGWRGMLGMKCQDNQMIPVKGPDAHSVMHNVVHLWIGGVWGPDGINQGQMVMNSSPNDPMFWLHHANIDRLWWVWEQTHGFEYRPQTGGPPGHNLYDTMWPFRANPVRDNTRITDLLNIINLGYTYV